MIGAMVVDEKGIRLGKVYDVVIQKENKLFYIAKKGLRGEEYAVDPADILGSKDVVIVKKGEKISTAFWDQAVCSLKSNKGKHLMDLGGRDWGELSQIISGEGGEPLFVTSGDTVVPSSLLRSIGDHIIVESVPDQGPYKGPNAETETLAGSFRAKLSREKGKEEKEEEDKGKK